MLAAKVKDIMALKPFIIIGSLALFAGCATAGNASEPNSTTGQDVMINQFSKLKIGGDHVEHTTLANGLELVVIPDHRAPVVTHMVWYKVGAADEAPGESGIAHFLEHLMFKGTKAAPEGKFSKAVAEVGGQENAFTSQDFTAYYQRVAKEHLPMVMGYEADRMANLVLTEAQVDPEREVVLEERALRVDRSPSARLSESFNQALYVNHPYGTPIIGWRDEIEQLSLDDAINFYNKYYTPNNAVLIVAGDVTFEEVLQLAKDTYGKVARRAEPEPRIRPQVQALPGRRIVSLHDAQVGKPLLQLGWLAPSAHSSSMQEAAVLQVLVDILGGGPNSRLYKELLLDKKLVTSVGAWYSSDALDSSRIIAYAAPKEGVGFEQIADEIRKTIAAIARDGVSAEELLRSKRSMLASAVYAQDNQETLAQIFGSALTTGRSVEQVQSINQYQAAVTAQQVQEAAMTYLSTPALQSRLMPLEKSVKESANAGK